LVFFVKNFRFYLFFFILFFHRSSPDLSFSSLNYLNFLIIYFIYIVTAEAEYVYIVLGSIIDMYLY